MEVNRLIEKMEIEAIQSAERERIGQEIHDGAMQGVYSVTLILNSMVKQLAETPPAAARLQQALQVLAQVLHDLRYYMTSLRTALPHKSVAEELAELAAQPRFSSLVDIPGHTHSLNTGQETAKCVKFLHKREPKILKVAIL